MDEVITYCGLCCLDCFRYHEKIPKHAKAVRDILSEYKFDRFVELAKNHPKCRSLKKYDDFKDVLDFLIVFECRPACKDRKFKEPCKIRACCIKKGMDGCWECKSFRECKKLDVLKPVHGNAVVKNFQILKTKGKKVFLKGPRNW